MNKEIRKYNNKGEFHGYQEWYMDNKLFYRGNYKNDEPAGYTEWFLSKKTFYIIR